MACSGVPQASGPELSEEFPSECGERRRDEESNDDTTTLTDEFRSFALDTGVEELQVPLIDLSGLEDYRCGHVVQAIGRACQEWGVFQVVNHDVPISLLEQTVRSSLKIFALPLAEKKLLSMDVAAHPSWNGCSSGERIRREFHTLSNSNCGNEQQSASEYERVCSNLNEEMNTLTQRLLGAISESLGLYSEYLNDVFGDSSQVVDCVRFSPSSQLEEAPIQVEGKQTDSGCLALIRQDECGGLEVLHDQRWKSIQPVPHGIVMTVGDQIEIVSNGKYKSARHRIVPKGTQPSMFMVVHNSPSHDAIIFPAPELTMSENMPLYPQIVFGDYLAHY